MIVAGGGRSRHRNMSAGAKLKGGKENICEVPGAPKSYLRHAAEVT